MGITRFPHGVSSFGVPIFGSGQDISGTTFFVDGNYGNDSNDGFSWEHPFKTLTVAFAASHADIARGSDRWARRNTIYISGDRFTETIVAFPQKTDVIGVGSCDSYKGAGILGNHAPVNTHYGTRFFNVNFFPAASGDLVTLTSSGSGTEFWDCGFVGVWGSYTAPSAIDSTASPMVKIRNCRFNGAFSAAVIDIGAGDASGLEIVENTIMGGASSGFLVDSGATFAGALGYGLIANNILYTTAISIDEDSDKCIVTGNECISAVASTTTATLVEVIDSNIAFSTNNRISCGDLANAPYPVVDTTGSV